MSGAEQAVNVFGALISLSVVIIVLWELKLNFLDKRGYYRYADVASNLFTMLLYGMLGAAAMGAIYLCYESIRGYAGIFEIRPDNLWAWIGGFVLTDLCHYWFHRTAHRNNFLWGIHQGHHTSEDFNLSTALRKGIFQQWVDWPFFLPMAVMGYPFFKMYLPLKGLQFAYQFWLHNQFVGKLGPVERVMVTPSLHRVHHGRNPEYIDRNYAGVFIVWDKLFGSFAEERADVRYGVTVPVRSFNPVGYQLTWWRNLWRDAAASDHWWDRVRTWFMPVGWRPASRREAPFPGKPDSSEPLEKFDLPVGLWTKVYGAIQLIVVGLVVGTLTGAEFEPGAVTGDTLVLVAAIWTSWSVGTLFNRSPRAVPFETVRSVALLGAWLWAHQAGVYPAQALLPVLVAHGVGMLWLLVRPGLRAGASSTAGDAPPPHRESWTESDAGA